MAISSPVDISGLVLFLNPDAEAGGDGASISSAIDYSGTSNTATAEGTITLTANAVAGRKAYDFGVGEGSFSLANTNNLTDYTFVAVSLPDSNPLNLYVGADSSSFIGSNDAPITLEDNGFGRSRTPDGSCEHLMLRGSAGEVRGWSKGEPMVRTSNLGVFTFTESGPRKFNNVGGFAQYRFRGKMAYVLLYDRALDAEEVHDLSDFINSRFGLVPNKLLLADGNSLTSGAGGTAWPSQLGLSYYEWDIYNLGAGGQTTAQMLADYSSQVAPLYSFRRPLNVLTAWELTNEIDAGLSAAQVQANIQAYCEGAQTTGFKVIVADCIPRGPFDAGRNAIRAEVNAWLDGAAAGFSDRFAQLTALPQFDADEDAADTTNYTGDQVHLNTTGYGVVADAFSEEIESIANEPPAAPTSVKARSALSGLSGLSR